MAFSMQTQFQSVCPSRCPRETLAPFSPQHYCCIQCCHFKTGCSICRQWAQVVDIFQIWARCNSGQGDDSSGSCSSHHCTQWEAWYWQPCWNCQTLADLASSGRWSNPSHCRVKWSHPTMLLSCGNNGDVRPGHCGVAAPYWGPRGTKWNLSALLGPKGREM